MRKSRFLYIYGAPLPDCFSAPALISFFIISLCPAVSFLYMSLRPALAFIPGRKQSPCFPCFHKVFYNCFTVAGLPWGRVLLSHAHGSGFVPVFPCGFRLRPFRRVPSRFASVFLQASAGAGCFQGCNYLLQPHSMPGRQGACQTRLQVLYCHCVAPVCGVYVCVGCPAPLLDSPFLFARFFSQVTQGV